MLATEKKSWCGRIVILSFGLVLRTFGPRASEEDTMRKEDLHRLGRNWRRRLEAAKGTLIDAEGLLKDLGCRDDSLSDVCEKLRQALERQ